jgi:predicted phage terminase large subunit-like protein
MTTELFRNALLGYGIEVGRATSWNPYPYQLPPDNDEWDCWLLLGGRGAGKTEAGARYVLDHLNKLGSKARVGVGAPTYSDARDVCAEGPSGLLTIGGDDFIYNRSTSSAKHRLGGTVKFLSAEEPARWNGPQWSLLWADELALWKEETWHQAQFGVRLGPHPRVIATTTPKARKFVKQLAELSGTAVTHGTTFDNVALAPSVMKRLEGRYGGTRLGRQELMGEFVGDIEGALWQADWIDSARRSEAPYELDENGKKLIKLERVVVSIDPAVTAKSESDETGIAVGGLGSDGDYYMLEISGYRLPPQQWAMKAIDMYDHWQADKIVAEVNNGGDMVVDTINNACTALGRSVNVEAIRASRGKTVRAEPIAALYEQGRVHHVGVFQSAEEQMCSFPIANEHDDLVDAMVYVLSDLANEGLPTIRFI